VREHVVTAKERGSVKVLIVKLSSIGDVVHTLPALYSLRKGLEKKGARIEIDWLVEEAASSLLTGNSQIDNVIVVKNRGWLRDTTRNLKTAKAIYSRRYDIVLDFQGLLKSGVWVAASRGKRRIGFSNARELSHIFLNEKLAPYDPEKHAVERYLDLAIYVGGSVDKTRTLIQAGKAARESVAKKLDEKGLKRGAPFFVMVTRARWATKLWNDEKFAELAKKISEGTDLTPVLVGGASERSGIEAIASGVSGAISLAGEIDLKELSALFGLARFAVTVDSGPMHIAAASGTRVAALFGPTAPWRTGPHGEGHVIIRKGLSCSPCFKKSCADVKCMNGITVDEVYNAISGLTGETGSRELVNKGKKKKADG
jgi:lipopolysaccharide heptosyltransferase I